MRPDEAKIDETDRKILQMLSDDGAMSFQKIASRLAISKSTVHNRVRALQEEGVIKGFHALLDPEKLGNNITAISLVRGKYGPDYSENIGRAISRISGVWAVYFVIGDVDFIVMIRCRNNEELGIIVEHLTKIEGVERSNTFYALSTLKENMHESVLIGESKERTDRGRGRKKQG
jgi:DNA-binding Lrp family transcriptional regulator